MVRGAALQALITLQEEKRQAELADQRQRRLDAVTPGSAWRHRKGGEYIVLSIASHMSVSPDLDGQLVVVYQDINTHRVYTRNLEEFADGRFTSTFRNVELCVCPPPVYSAAHLMWTHTVWNGECSKCHLKTDYDLDKSTNPARKVPRK